MGICCDFKRKDPQSENIRCKTEPDQEEHSQFLAYPKPKSKLALNRPFTDINVSTQRQKIKHNSLTQIQAPYNQNRNNQNNTLKDKKVFELLGIIYIYLYRESKLY